MSKVILFVEIICLLSVISACSDDPPTAPLGATSDWDNSMKVEGSLVTYTCITGEEVKAVCDAVSLTWKPSSIMCPDSMKRTIGKKIKHKKKVKRGKKGKKSGKKGKKRTGRKHGKKSGKKYDGRKPQDCTCGVKMTSRIVGGHAAQDFEWPWIARLLYKSNSLCGGSLISDQWILSAAHCTIHRKAEDFIVKLGDYNTFSLDFNERLFGVSKIINHAYYGHTLPVNDISLLKLINKVDLGKYSPVCLPNPGKTYTGEIVDIYGWGITLYQGPKPNVLMESQVEVIINSECNDRYMELDISIINRHICAYTSGSDTCQGDSGGPVTYNDSGKHKQIGIVSFGRGCAGDYPGVYTRVTEYLGWIKKNTETDGGAAYCN